MTDSIQPGQRQHQASKDDIGAINCPIEWVRTSLESDEADSRRAEGQQADEEQEQQVIPEQAVVIADHVVEIPVVRKPVDPGNEERKKVAEEMKANPMQERLNAAGLSAQ